MQPTEPQSPAPVAAPKPIVTLAGARAALDAAIAHATARGWAVCIAVCDPGGNPVVSARMDGAPLLSMQIAVDKAWTVANFGGLPTHEWWGLIEDDPALVHGITQTPRLVVFGGGIPLLAAGALVGAIGVSGGSAAEDREVAEAGAAAIN